MNTSKGRGMVNPKGLEGKDSPPFRLMDLPREVRDNVYRELLLPTKARASPKRYYTLQPAILRACKQTYKESSRVLYEEAKWVLVTTFEDAKGVITNLKEITLYPFIAVQTSFSFPRTPVLCMNMTSGNDNDKHQAFMLIPRSAFPVLGKLFLLHHCTRIVLQFDAVAMQVPAIREDILHCCRDFRGSHSVTIEGLDRPTECAELLEIMTTPILRAEEYLKTANTYQQRAANQVARGLFLDADGTYRALVVYLRTIEKRRVEGNLSSSDSHGKVNFKELGIDFGISSAYCRTKAGLPQTSRALLDSILANDGKHPSLTKQQEVRIHYYKGLALVAEHNDIEALKEFRSVLSLEPGHEGADEEVDSMEARLQRMPQTKSCEVEAYLSIFVRPHRHREPGSAEMPVYGLPDVLTLEKGWSARASK